jgi:hypothetical protein
MARHNLRFTLSLGLIDDIDSTFVNGTLVGTRKINAKERLYTVEQFIM